MATSDGKTVVEKFPICENADKSDGLDFNFFNSQALAYEAEGFADAFEKWQQSKKDGAGTVVIEHPFRTHQESIVDAEIIDKVMADVKLFHANK